MPVVTTARIPTPHASRYLQQLCKHWSHRFVVDHMPDSGEVGLPAGPLTLTAEADALVLRLSVADADQVARVQGVVAEHLDRFAFREGPLVYDWRLEGVTTVCPIVPPVRKSASSVRLSQANQACAGTLERGDDKCRIHEIGNEVRWNRRSRAQPRRRERPSARA